MNIHNKSCTRRVCLLLGLVSISAVASATYTDLASFTNLDAHVFDIATTSSTLSLSSNSSGLDLFVDKYGPSGTHYVNSTISLTGLVFTQDALSTKKWNLAAPASIKFYSAGNTDVLDFSLTSGSVRKVGSRYLFSASSALVGVGNSGYTIHDVDPGSGYLNFSFVKSASGIGYGGQMGASIETGDGDITPEPFTCGLALAGVGLFVRRRLKK